MIRIIRGLQVGEVVLLTPPLAPATVEQQGADRAVGEGQKPETKKIEDERPKVAGEPSPEQRQKMREKFEKMSDEEKEKMRKQWEGKRQQQTGAGE
jgi:hypothetical protein